MCKKGGSIYRAHGNNQMASVHGFNAAICFVKYKSDSEILVNTKHSNQGTY